jgi:hypothetical protein
MFFDSRSFLKFGCSYQVLTLLLFAQTGFATPATPNSCAYQVHIFLDISDSMFTTNGRTPAFHEAVSHLQKIFFDDLGALANENDQIRFYFFARALDSTPVLVTSPKEASGWMSDKLRPVNPAKFTDLTQPLRRILELSEEKRGAFHHRIFIVVSDFSHDLQAANDLDNLAAFLTESRERLVPLLRGRPPEPSASADSTGRLHLPESGGAPQSAVDAPPPGADVLLLYRLDPRDEVTALGQDRTIKTFIDALGENLTSQQATRDQALTELLPASAEALNARLVRKLRPFQIDQLEPDPVDPSRWTFRILPTSCFRLGADEETQLHLTSVCKTDHPLVVLGSKQQGKIKRTQAGDPNSSFETTFSEGCSEATHREVQVTRKNDEASLTPPRTVPPTGRQFVEIRADGAELHFGWNSGLVLYFRVRGQVTKSQRIKLDTFSIQQSPGPQKELTTVTFEAPDLKFSEWQEYSIKSKIGWLAALSSDLRLRDLQLELGEEAGSQKSAKAPPAATSRHFLACKVGRRFYRLFIAGGSLWLFALTAAYFATGPITVDRIASQLTIWASSVFLFVSVVGTDPILSRSIPFAALLQSWFVLLFSLAWLSVVTIAIIRCRQDREVAALPLSQRFPARRRRSTREWVWIALLVVGSATAFWNFILPSDQSLVQWQGEEPIPLAQLRTYQPLTPAASVTK